MSWKAGLALSLSSLAMFSTPAMAGWKTVETDHFVYYSEDDIDQVRQNVVQLETFDKLVRALTSNTAPPSTVKVRIFELKDIETLNRLLGSYGIGGFYTNNDIGPYIFTFRNAVRNRGTMFRSNDNSVAWAPEVRQHEYLHHYMYQYFNSNYPSWYSEGFAEYYGTMAFAEDGVVEIGHAPYFRMNSFRNGAWVDVEQLLTARSYAEIKDIRAIYAQGWLLTHLAARNPERGKQLADYLRRIANGEAYASAAKASFGDLGDLNKELRKHKDNISAVRLSLKPIDIGAINVSELSDSESAFFDYMVRLNLGIPERDLPQIRSHLSELRKTDPDNSLGIEVQARLAQAAEDYEEELALGEILLAQDPESRLGAYFKGHALVEMVANGSPDSAYEEGRALLAKAARADLNIPEPLIDFYRSYLLTDGIPPATAQNALMRAFELLPGHQQVRQYVARDFEWRGMYEEAIHVIKPAAFGTFDGDEGDRRRRAREIEKAVEKHGRRVVVDTPGEMLKRLEAKRDGKWDDATGTIIESGQEPSTTS